MHSYLSGLALRFSPVPSRSPGPAEYELREDWCTTPHPGAEVKGRRNKRMKDRTASKRTRGRNIPRKDGGKKSSLLLSKGPTKGVYN